MREDNLLCLRWPRSSRQPALAGNYDRSSKNRSDLGHDQKARQQFCLSTLPIRGSPASTSHHGDLQFITREWLASHEGVGKIVTRVKGVEVDG
jgi:hypothetical protein